MATIDVSPVAADIKSKLSSAGFKYPITSATALKATATGATVTAAGRTVQLDSVLPQLPGASYPITSETDLEQKVSALVSARASAASKGLAELTGQLPRFNYPVANAAQLVAQASSKTYTFQGKPVDVQKAAAQIPATDFPISSAADFDTKTSSLALSLALITSGPGSVL